MARPIRFRPVTDVRPPSGRPGGISLELHLSQAYNALADLAEHVTDYSVPNRQVGIQLYGWVIRNFQQGGGMQSPPWQPLSERTLKRKQREGYSSLPLLRRGNLRQSFAPFADDTQAGVGARASFGVDYAQVHERGTDRVPQRSMLPPREYALNAAVQIYQLHIETGRRRSGL